MAEGNLTKERRVGASFADQVIPLRNARDAELAAHAGLLTRISEHIKRHGVYYVVTLGGAAAFGILANQNNKPKDPAVYEGKYYIPTPQQEHREIVAGPGQVLDGIVLANIDSIRDAIHQANPKISQDEAIDLLEAENVQFQRQEGIPKDKIDPVSIQDGQTFLLPEEYGVGRKVAGQK